MDIPLVVRRVVHAAAHWNRRVALVATTVVHSACFSTHAAEPGRDDTASTVELAISDLKIVLPAGGTNLTPEEQARNAQIQVDIERWVREEQLVTNGLIDELTRTKFDGQDGDFAALASLRIRQATQRGEALHEYGRFVLTAKVLQSREQFAKAEALARIVLAHVEAAQRTAASAQVAEKLLLLEAEILGELLGDPAGAADTIEQADHEFLGNSQELHSRSAAFREKARQIEQIEAASAVLRERLEYEADHPEGISK